MNKKAMTWDLVIEIILSLVIVFLISYTIVSCSRPSQDLNKDLVCLSAIQLSNNQGLQLDYNKCPKLYLAVNNEKEVVNDLMRCNRRFYDLDPKSALKSYLNEYNDVENNNKILLLDCMDIDVKNQITFGKILNENYKSYKYLTYLTNDDKSNKESLSCIKDFKDSSFFMGKNKNYIIYKFVAKNDIYQDHEVLAKSLISDNINKICSNAFYNDQAMLFIYDDTNNDENLITGLLLAKNTFKLNLKKSVYYKLQGEIND